MATSIPENEIILDLTDTYGSMLVGGWLSCIIWGVSSLQTFIYFATYENDHWNKKLLIFVLWIFDTVNEIVVLISLWPVLIKNFGSIAILSQIQRPLIHHAWIAQLLECAVQLFFTHRIWIFSGKKWLFPVCMIFLSLFQVFILIPYDVTVYGTSNALAALATHSATSIVITLRAVTAFEDVALTVALMYLLLKNGLPEYQSSKRMAIRLLIVTANTGMWTAVVALVELCLVAKFPTGLQFTIVEFPLCSLYFSSLLASLNSREYVKGNHYTVWNETPSHLTGSRASKSTGNTMYLSQMKFSKTTEITTDTQSAPKFGEVEEGRFRLGEDKI